MRSAARFVCSLAVGALLAVPLAVTVAGEVGREFSRCIQMCNDVRQACEHECSIGCEEMYPSDATQSRACFNACKDACVEQDRDCRLRCKAIKDSGSPTNP